MNEILFGILFILPVLQVLIYLYLDSKKIKNAQKYAFFLIIFLDFILIPYLMSSEINNEVKTNNSHPSFLAIFIFPFLLCWIIGGILTLSTHYIYILIRRFKKPNETKNEILSKN